MVRDDDGVGHHVQDVAIVVREVLHRFFHPTDCVVVDVCVKQVRLVACAAGLAGVCCAEQVCAGSGCAGESSASNGH